LVAGGVAGASSRTITSPLERIKILFQVQNGPQLRNVPGGLVWGTLRQVYREEGLRGYFKGNGTKYVPYQTLSIVIYTK
jgi:solute carrier family 25 phosphate transporter 23/24/25/41